MWATQILRFYVQSKKCSVCFNQASLRVFMKISKPSARLMRRRRYLSDFGFNIKYEGDLLHVRVCDEPGLRSLTETIVSFDVDTTTHPLIFAQSQTTSMSPKSTNYSKRSLIPFCHSFLFHLSRYNLSRFTTTSLAIYVLVLAG